MSTTSETGARTEPAIGDRPLFAVQSLEIGRLSGHLVPLTPGAFIPVSGEGDQNDSNGSGKTTFLAIASLLLGDPQWRLGNSSGNELINLLFDPELAGAAGLGYGHASHGYVIGVFGDGDAAVRSVWMRINRDHREKLGPLQVRVYQGFVVGRGDSDRERLAAADDHWQAERHQAQFGLRDYAAALYGARPRVSAYVRSRGGRGSGPSLLAAEVDQFSPETIGAELLRLCGQEELLQHDAQQRRDRANARRQRKEAIDEDAVASVREAGEIKVLDGLDAARAAVRLAAEHWNDHFAQQLVDSEAALAADRVAIAENQERLTEASLEENRRRRALKDMLDPSALREEVGELERQHAEANQAVQGAETVATRHAFQIEQLLEQVRRARKEAVGWLPGRCGIAEERLVKATADHTQCVRDRDLADDEAGRAEDRLASVRAHGRLETAAALTTLRMAGVAGACALFDSLSVKDSHRELLEPMLLPWRNAVVVGASERAEALTALARFPGTVLISGEDDGPRLPDDIEAPPGARRFIRTLLDGSRRLQDGSVESIASDVTVIGPLPRPITGTEAAVAEAEADLTAAREKLAAAAAAADMVERTLASARTDAARAEAADRANALSDELAEAKVEHAGAEAAAEKERLVRAAIHGQLRPALERLASYDARRTQADLALGRATYDKQTIVDALSDLKRANGDRLRAFNLNPFANRQEEARARAAQVGRDETTSRRLANEELLSALHHLGIDPRSGEGAEQHDPQILLVVRRRSELSEGQESRISFDELAGPFTQYLDRRQASDLEQRERITRTKAERAARLDGYEKSLAHLDGELESLGETIESAVRARLDEVGRRFDELDRAKRGHGARLAVEVVRGGDSADWVVSVTPEWARGPNERPVSYRRPGNTAMKKQRTINLVLAALLDEHRAHRGGVLILDELGDSLGQQHRIKVLSAIAEAAADAGITVLATCQDSMLDAAGQFAHLVIYFRYLGGTEVVNRAPALYGYDSDLARVRLSADAVLDGRPLG